MEGVKTFTNIDVEDFEGMYGGEKQVIEKGETKTFPETIANHLANQLAIKILIRQKKNYLTDPSKPELLKKILGQVVAPPEEPEKEKGEGEGLGSKTAKELKALAKEKGIDIKGLKKKTEIIAAIEAGTESEGEEEKEFPGLKE